MSPSAYSRHSKRLRKTPVLEALESRTLLAGTPVLLQDINPILLNGDPIEMVDLNGIAILRFEYASGLVRSDGTEAGTYQIVPDLGGDTMLAPGGLAVIGDKVYFSANRLYKSGSPTSSSGHELWETDGTSIGTRFIADIEPSQSTFGGFGSSPEGFVGYGGLVYFIASTLSAGRELWVTNGSVVSQVADIQPGPGNSLPQELTVAGGRLFFSAIDTGSFRNLFSFTGSTPVRLTQSVTVRELTAVGNDLFFAAKTSTGVEQLWKTNGTLLGTFMLKSFTGSGSAALNSLTAVGNTLYFNANDSSTGSELWKSDGTVAGTVRVADIAPGIIGSNPTDLVAFGGQLYFSATTLANGRELFRSDGTATGTELVIEINAGSASAAVGQLHVVGSTLYFAADNGVHGKELWKTNGTLAGTAMVSDIRPGSASSNPDRLSAVGNNLFFRADDGLHGRELWFSDGTKAGTRLASDLAPGGQGSTNSVQDYRVGDSILFFANDGTGLTDSLFSTQGRQGDVRKVQGFYGSPSSSARVVFNDELYFAAGQEGGSNALWKTNGDPSGTVVLKGGLSITTLNWLGSLVYFWANDDGNWGLWSTDGTTAGTQPVVGPWTGDPYTTLTRSGNLLYFVQNDGVNGSELWRTDGTAAGTFVVKDINPGSSTSDPRNLTDVNGVLSFSAYDPTFGVRLWKTDGTTAGTIPVAAPLPLSETNTFFAMSNFVAFDGMLYFSLGNYSQLDIGGLWRSDGTTAGTFRIAPFSAVRIYRPVVMGDHLYFSGRLNGSNTYGLYKTDGTSTGTVALTSNDFNRIETLAASEDEVFFHATNAAYGSEVWTTDGTVEGTVVHEMIPGSASPHFIDGRTVIGDTFFFVAASPWGVEPFVLETDNLDPIADAGGPYVVTEGQPLTLDASGSFDPEPEDILTFSWDLNGDGVFTDAYGANPTIDWATLLALGINDNGTYVANVRVSDGQGGVAYSGILPGSGNLTVLNGSPTTNPTATVFAIREVSLKLFASDPSPLDQAAEFLFEIDWNGDGRYDETVSGMSGTEITHVFETAGNHTIRVRATDKDGGKGQAFSTIVTVADAGIHQGNLIWLGTLGADSVAFEQTGPNQITLRNIRINGVPSSAVRVFDGITGRVIATGGRGNDVINASGLSTIISEIRGGSGADTILGGDAADMILGDSDGGEGGNDSILAGDGDDTVFADGSEGRSDFVAGGDGNDVIYSDPVDGAEGGPDTVLGGDGDDRIEVGTGADSVDGGIGNDLLVASDPDPGFSPDDTFLGGAGDDVIIAAAGGDLISGGTGYDLLLAASLDDRFYANWGDGLQQIWQVWRSNQSFAVRQSHLTGGPGSPIDPAFYLVPGNAVLNDSAIDAVIANDDAEEDWILGDLSWDNISAGPSDIITDIGP